VKGRALPVPDLTLVIDIGKSHAKLLLVDADGQVVERHGRSNAPVVSPLGYPALDIAGLTQWMSAALAASQHTQHCGRAIVSTHGAAFVALGDDGLAWAPLDYEFEGCTQPGSALDVAYRQACDPFAVTFSPDLPMGLNAARQLYWLQHVHPKAWAATRTLLPYPQYWAWWLCGVASSEVSSLGCHTQLWSVRTGQFSGLAQAQGWAALFAPLQSAWQVLGPVHPQLADSLGLPRSCQVHVGVHDSNACLARYLGFPSKAHSLTLVSSGTWTVLMAPDAPTTTLQAELDMLGNVSVLGQPTPTARFMGGREFSALLDGAPADLGTERDLQQLVQAQTFAMPAFANQGGPFMAQQGHVLRRGQPCELQVLTGAGRSALAALYCAQMTAWLVQCLRPETPGEKDEPDESGAADRRLVVEGPLASNQLYMGVLQSLLDNYTCLASVDEMEGTARGAWLLSRWSGESHASGAPDTSSFLQAVRPLNISGLHEYHQRWVGLVAGLTSAARRP
jgi:sugar (pentulose or hexulose) kinase